MPLDMKMTRAWAEIDLSAIRQNFNAAAAHAAMHGAKLIAVVKANAYGHGAVKISKELERFCNAEYFAVATLVEAIELCEGGITAPIIILSEIHPTLYGELVKYENIIPSIFHLDSAKELSAAAVKAGTCINFFLVADSGMARIGIDITSDNKLSEGVKHAIEITSLPNIALMGLFSHYATADESDKTAAFRQTEYFDKFVHSLREAGINPAFLSMCNSAALTESAFTNKYDLARLGISLYGLNPSEYTAKILPIKPAMALRARVTAVKDLDAGVGISYGHTFITSKPTRVATIPVGYADGYPRLLSGKASVIIDDKEAPILGRICMDQMMVDVTDIPSATVGSVATLMGADKRVRADTLASMMGTIPYELICAVSPRMPRIYTNAYASINEK